MDRIVAQASPWPPRCHSDIGAPNSRSTSSSTPQAMPARAPASWGAPGSPRPKPGRSISTVRQPKPSSSGSSLRQWKVLVSGEDSSSSRLRTGTSGRATQKCTRMPEKDRYRLSSVNGTHPRRRFAFVTILLCYSNISGGGLQRKALN